MLLMSIEHLRPGIKLAKAICSADGVVLLSANLPLTSTSIHRLRCLGVASVFVLTECTQDVIVEDCVDTETRQKVMSITKQAMESAKIRHTFIVEELQEQIDNILTSLMESKEVLLQLTDIRAQRDYTFVHSVNVCITSLIIGIAMGYSGEQLRTLGLGALLHDIGKGKIPAYILEKPGKLSAEEFSIIQEHSKYGFEMLYENGGIEAGAALVALQHHERYDGTGYPWKLERDGICEYARIVAVADVYDALTTDRVYRRRFLPNEALSIIDEQTGTHFDPAIVKAFRKLVALYPVGCLVQLNTREIAFVTAVSPESPTRPAVRIAKKEGRARKFVNIDLRESTKYHIKRIIRS